MLCLWSDCLLGVRLSRDVVLRVGFVEGCCVEGVLLLRLCLFLFCLCVLLTFRLMVICVAVIVLLRVCAVED